MLILGLTSCEKDGSTPLENSNLLTKLEIQKIGIQHNEALNYVLDGLKKTNISNFKSTRKMEKFLNEELGKYYKTIIKNDASLKNVIQLSNKEVSKYLELSNKSSYSKDENKSPIELVISENEQHLSSSQVDFLLQVDEALKSFDGGNVTSILNTFETIQNLAQSQLTETEAQVILISVEVGKMSVAYWNEHIEEWNQALNQSQGNKFSNRSWFSWSGVAGADVAGAVGAAVTVAIVNVAPGAGQVAYGTAVVSTAAGASVGQAVSQVWNHIFN